MSGCTVRSFEAIAAVGRGRGRGDAAGLGECEGSGEDLGAAEAMQGGQGARHRPSETIKERRGEGRTDGGGGGSGVIRGSRGRVEGASDYDTAGVQ